MVGIKTEICGYPLWEQSEIEGILSCSEKVLVVI